MCSWSFLAKLNASERFREKRTMAGRVTGGESEEPIIKTTAFPLTFPTRHRFGGG